MLCLRISDDLGECRRLWNSFWPRETLFDEWAVREIFARQFDRPPCFVVAQRGGAVVGLMALSWIGEEGYYGQFPGETWNSRTWIEQNRIPALDQHVREELLGSVPGPLHLRYLTRDSLPQSILADESVDEVGYLFEPRRYGYDFGEYMASFSGKARKKLRREQERLEAGGVSHRFDHLPDIDLMFQMNIEAFGDRSYFHDPRFLRSFEALAGWLRERGLLRVTTILLGGQVAAVDVGAVVRGVYTVLAGGTAPEFAGVAKLINFLHMQWACSRKLALVDFLCGNFSWKQRFHLSPRSLFEIRTTPAEKLQLSASKRWSGTSESSSIQSARGRDDE